MRYIGNIISDKKIEISEFINVVDSFDKIKQNLPILIIGYNDYVKPNFDNKKISVIDRYIDDKTMWTFGKYERASEYERDLREFQENIFDELKIITDYRYFNLLTTTLTEKKDIITVLKSPVKKYIYIHEEKMVYVHITNEIIGFLLDDVEFLGVGREKIINWLKSLKNSKIIDNVNFLTFRTQKFIQNSNFLIPVLYKMKYS